MAAGNETPPETGCPAGRTLQFASAKGQITASQRQGRRRRLEAASLLTATAAMTLHDEVDIADMDWSEDLQAFTYQCPCGDLFQITLEELAAGTRCRCLARCPLCGPSSSQLSAQGVPCAAGTD